MEISALIRGEVDQNILRLVDLVNPELVCENLMRVQTATEVKDDTAIPINSRRC